MRGQRPTCCHICLPQNGDLLDNEIRYDRDFDYDYFGFKVRHGLHVYFPGPLRIRSWPPHMLNHFIPGRSLTSPPPPPYNPQTLERSYLLRIGGKVVERPQHMLMRVSVGIHKDDIASAIQTYHLMSERMFTHASPTLFNAGTPRPQLSSCFLLCMKNDSIEGIYDTLKECAVISKSAGGIGLSIHNIRATGSYIRGTNGSSNGILPMLRVFNDTARYEGGRVTLRGQECVLCCCQGGPYAWLPLHLQYPIPRSSSEPWDRFLPSS